MLLGTIQCSASEATLNSLLHLYGFQAIPQKSDSVFDVVSFTRHSDPVVEEDLFSLALGKLTAAQNDGAIPRWQLIEA